MLVIARMAPLLVCFLYLAGCTSVYSTFPGQSPEVVFKTMVAVANSPLYTDRPLNKQWFVRQNEVYVKTESNQIEIYRELGRTRKYQARPPQPEERTWEIEITFDPDSQPPRATFTSIGWSVPAHVQSEGEAFFRQVHELLNREDATIGDTPVNASENSTDDSESSMVITNDEE